MSDGKEIGLLFELIQTFKIKCFVEIIILCTSYGLIQFSKYNQCGPFFFLILLIHLCNYKILHELCCVFKLFYWCIKLYPINYFELYITL